MEALEVFAVRLRNARIMKGFSMDDLSNAMREPVSKMAISKYESGTLKPNSTTLINLSNALGVPIDYFFRPFSYKIGLIEFRKKTALPTKQENAIKERIADIAERYFTIEEICNASVPFSPLPRLVNNVEEAKKAALKIRSNWDIGSDGIIDVISMLEEHGIKVIEINAPDSFDGLSTFINCSNPIIVLNKNMQPERIRFTALHELGHLIMRFKDGLGKREIENLCNTFANEMLIPETEFKSIVGDKRKYISYNELAYMQRQFGISCDALMHKAKDSNVISDRYYRGFCIRKRSNPDYRKLIENSVYPRENSSRFERLVYQALSKDMISTSSAASLLNIPIDEVKRNASYQ